MIYLKLMDFNRIGVQLFNLKYWITFNIPFANLWRSIRC